ncbi:hypothetical protein J2S19_001815 [Metabacillus malikii]|uniref:Uncharacterized protein n=1 Tax=Metabacillus malikii TaxID=1504265 RepID=A0ABT9ZE65_9BACI|nr:hypothetical protein [Metabacillus malikii]
MGTFYAKGAHNNPVIYRTQTSSIYRIRRFEKRSYRHKVDFHSCMLSMKYIKGRKNNVYTPPSDR